MTNTPQHYPDENPTPKKTLRERFRGEYDRVLELNKKNRTCESVAKPDIQPMELADYIAESTTIPKELIMDLEAPNPEDIPRSFENSLVEATRICYIITNFDNGGFKLENLEPESQRSFFEENKFVQEILVMNSDGVSEWGRRKGYFFEQLPEIIQQDISKGGCTFELNYPYSGGDHRNKEWFAAQKAQALQNLKAIFNMNLNNLN